MRRPVPPATFKTLVPETRTDLQRLRDHSKDILDWIDEAGGGGANLIAGPGISITGTDPLTVAVDPAGVPLTGDVNGSANANQVNKIHETSGPTALTIGAVSDGQVLVRSGTNLIGTSGGMPSGNPYVDPPTVASSLDDEFSTGSSDLATRGWTVRNHTTSTVCTRVGDIDPFYTTPMAANEYRSTLVGSYMQVQIPPTGNEYIMYRPMTFTSGYIWARVGISSARNDSVTTSLLPATFCYTLLCGSSGGVPSFTNYIGPAINNANGSAGSQTSSLFWERTRGGANTTRFVARNEIAASTDILGLKINGGSSYNFFAVDSNGTIVADSEGAVNSGTNCPDLSNLAFGGFLFRNQFSNGTASIYTIDFFRTKSTTTANAWIAQTPRPVLWNVVSGDISQYPQKSTPVAADQIYLADSEASNTTKRVTLDTATVAFTRILSPPVSPSTFDDEFSSGSADLSTRGWAILDIVTGVALTRAGSVSYMGALPAAGTYNSDIVRGQLVLQIPFGVQVFISKAVSSANPYTYVMRGSSQAGNHCWVWTNASSTFNTGNGYGVGQVSGSLRGCGIASKTGTTFTQRITYGSTLEGTSDTFWLSVPGSGTGTFAAQTINPYSGFPFYYTATALTTYTPAFAGIELYCNANPSWYTIDFIRQYAGQGIWFA